MLQLNAPDDVCMQLLPHQRLACNFVKSHPYCGLFLPMGLGKTSTTLEALYELNPTHHVLILGPKPVMRTTWADEIEKWGFPFRVNSLITNERGTQLTAAKRHEKYAAIYDHQPTVWFLNYELTVDLIEHLPRVKGKPIWPFPTVILDEAQAFKSPNSKRFKALKKMRPYMQRVIELTGTPAPNGVIDIWSLIYLLDQGARLGSTLTQYRTQWFVPTGYIDNRPYGWVPRPGSSDIIFQAISDITISFDSLASTIPPVTYNDVKVQLSKEERALYKEMVKERVLTFQVDEETHEAIAVNAAVLSAKLSQMASGALYLDGTNTEWAHIHDRKLDACVNIIENAGSPVIVAYHFKSDMKMLVDRFKEEKIEAEVLDNSPDMVHRWNEGKIPVLLIQPASSGHGLNLQEGGYTLIWYTLPWSLEHYLQTNARLARQGQKHPVIIHRLLCEGTIDTKINNALKNKDTSQTALLNAVKLTLNDAIID